MKMRKILALVLAALMLLSLCACQQTGNGTKPSNTTPSTAEETTYKVTVIGADGNPATTGVVVQFLKNGEECGMASVDSNGVASKKLEKADYTVELVFTDSSVSYYYDTTDLTLSKTKTELNITLCLKQGEESKTVYAGDMEYSAYYVTAGNTYVTLQPGRNYFLYIPTESGEYDLFTTNGAYKVGYFGGVHYIMETNRATENSINGIGLSIQPGQVSEENEMVIGVDNPGTEAVQTVLHISRIGDYIDTSIPRVIYKTTHSLTPWTLPAGLKVNKFDISGVTEYNLVLNETTGFYHLDSENGPLVVVFLGKKAEASYMPYVDSYDTILLNTHVCAYFLNESGEGYAKCEEYSNTLLEYIGVYDEVTKQYIGGCIDRNSGMYPLTADLMYIIQQNGSYSGWWDKTDNRYIFGDMNVDPENAWLFMCGYLG